MAEKRQHRKTGAGGRATGSKASGAGEKTKGKEKEVDLEELGKAGEHLIMSATELVVGTGFAIKGVKNLLEEKEGRKLLLELPFKAMSKGFDMVKKAEEDYRAKKKAGSRGSSSTKSRKINVD